MDKIYNVLIKMLRIVMILMVGVLFFGSIGFIKKLTGDSFTNQLFILEIVALLGGSIIIFSKLRHRYKIWSLLLIALFFRAFWIFNIDTLPISDFASMYENAKSILAGDMSVLKGYTYLARFPHLIPMTFYIAGIMKIFSANTLIVLKIMNVIFGSTSVYLIYKLSDNFIRSERNKLFVLLLGAIFPAFITYTSVLCTENIAIPLYLLSLIIFYKAKNKNENKNKYFFASGMLLALGNLFRGVAIVVLIAISICLFVENRKGKYKNIGSVILGYVVIALCISGTLLNLDIVERPLWKGAEPSSITLLLKGSNFEHNGMWNLEDAQFIDNHLRDDNLAELCIEKIKDRITSKTPMELISFYSKKFIAQWTTGDCSGTYWAYEGAGIKLNTTLPVSFQYIYVAILGLSFVGMFNKENNVLINIMLFGFILLFMIIETQARYSYIVSFVFIILAAQGLETIITFIEKGKLDGFKNKRFFRENFFKPKG